MTLNPDDKFAQTVSVLGTFLLAMTLHPEVQRKAQHELDRVIGKNNLPSFSDRPAWSKVSCKACGGESSRFINRQQFERTMSQMRSRGSLILKNRDDDYIVLLRILAGLVTADVIEPYVEYLDSEAVTDEVLRTSPSLSAGMAACTVQRQLLDAADRIVGNGGLAVLENGGDIDRFPLDGSL